MRLVNVHQAKTTLSRLLEEVENGNEVIIGRSGKPVARLVPFKSEKSQKKRPLGKWRIRETSQPEPVQSASIAGDDTDIQLL